jgi:TnpA family transposase
LPWTQLWDGGDLASADGLRFRTPTRTVHAGPNPKYFGVERGITWINFTSGHGTGFHGIVVPGTLRDSLYILEGLLEHQTDLEPTEIMSDSAGASEIVFALFWLLGYQFSPRLADVGGARFWRINADADYGAFNDLSRHRVQVNRSIVHWDDILRIVGSLRTGVVSASELMRSLLSTKRASPVARALRELGRIVKTIHHLNYISDPVYRRRTLTQLNHHENRHRLTRRVYHGKRGEVRKHYREGQEEQLGVLGLVVNAIVLWNTIYFTFEQNMINMADVLSPLTSKRQHAKK